MSRTDEHRIAVLDPAEYRLVSVLDTHEEDGSYEAFYPEFEDLDGLFMDLDGTPGKCRICGQSHGNRYWAFFQHEPTDDLIQVGSLCASKVGLADRKALEEVRAHEGRRMAQVRGHFLHGDPVRQHIVGWACKEVEGLELNETGTRYIGTEGFPQEFASSLLAYFNREGRFSEKQEALALKLEAEKPEREERARKQAEEEAKLTPIPDDLLEGRHEFTGKVISCKWKSVPGTYYDQGGYKMLVLDDRGFKIWGTAASGITPEIDIDLDDLIGSRVSFSATLVKSDRDESFGFFKRPTKAQVIS